MSLQVEERFQNNWRPVVNNNDEESVHNSMMMDNNYGNQRNGVINGIPVVTVTTALPPITAEKRSVEMNGHDVNNNV